MAKRPRYLPNEDARGYWVEDTMGDGIKAAVLVRLSDQGVPTVAEVRLMPAVDGPTIGQWEVSSGALDRLRPGGIGTRALRSVPLRRLLEEGRRRSAITAHDDAATAAAHGESPSGATAAQLAARGQLLATPLRRPGRKGHGARFFAVWAQRYSLADPRRPYPDMAATYKGDPALAGLDDAARVRLIKAWVLKARNKYGFLTPAIPGRAQGTLEPAALAALAKED